MGDWNVFVQFGLPGLALLVLVLVVWRLPALKDNNFLAASVLVVVALIVLFVVYTHRTGPTLLDTQNVGNAEGVSANAKQ